MEEILPNYRLSLELNHHQGNARCIAARRNVLVSGGSDGRLVMGSIVYKSSGHRDFVENWTSRDADKTPIYSVVIDNNLEVYSGTQKGHIKHYSKEGDLLGIKSAHLKIVNSLELSPNNTLVSGSWDATARVWSPNTVQCIASLSEQHAHAVTVCAPWPGIIVTGSQNGTLNLWKENTIVSSIERAHADIIRSIYCVDHEKGLLISCANSGDVKFWIVDNCELRSIPIDQYPDGWIATDTSAFLFDCQGCVIRQHTLLCLVGADDGTAILFLGELVLEANEQVVMVRFVKTDVLWQHTSSVWKVAILEPPNGTDWPDLATACGDGYVRIFTALANLAMGEDKIRLKTEETAQILAAASAVPKDTVDINKLVSVLERNRIRNVPVGKTMLFKSADGHSVEVHSWTGSEWQKVGDMIQPPGSDSKITKASQHYVGDDFFPAGVYDYVFQVAIESKPGPRCVLPYRLTDNAMEVAERFCAREGISKHNVPDILDFISKNARPLPREAPLSPKPAELQQPSPPRTNSDSSLLEASLPIIFNGGSKWRAAVERLLQLNDRQEKNKQLSSVEKSDLYLLLEILEAANFESSIIRQSDLASVLDSPFPQKPKWASWEPRSELFPMFDIWRKLASHPAAADYFRRGGKGNLQVAFVFDWLKQLGPEENVTLLCALRWLANICSWSSTRTYFVEHLESLLIVLKELLRREQELGNSKKNETMQALHACCFNVSQALAAETQRVKAGPLAAQEALISKITALADFVTELWSYTSSLALAGPLTLQTLALLNQGACRLRANLLSTWDKESFLKATADIPGAINMEARKLLKS